MKQEHEEGSESGRRRHQHHHTEHRHHHRHDRGDDSRSKQCTFAHTLFLVSFRLFDAAGPLTPFVCHASSSDTTATAESGITTGIRRRIGAGAGRRARSETEGALPIVLLPCLIALAATWRLHHLTLRFANFFRSDSRGDDERHRGRGRVEEAREKDGGRRGQRESDRERSRERGGGRGVRREGEGGVDKEEGRQRSAGDDRR